MRLANPLAYDALLIQKANWSPVKFRPMTLVPFVRSLFSFWNFETGSLGAILIIAWGSYYCEDAACFKYFKSNLLLMTLWDEEKQTMAAFL